MTEAPKVYRYQLRISQETHDKIGVIAQRQHRSIHSLILEAIDNLLADDADHRKFAGC